MPFEKRNQTRSGRRCQANLLPMKSRRCAESDGVLNRDDGYIYRPNQFCWIDGAPAESVISRRLTSTESNRWIQEWLNIMSPVLILRSAKLSRSVFHFPVAFDQAFTRGNTRFHTIPVCISRRKSARINAILQPVAQID